jgi:hypothetical protein
MKEGKEDFDIALHSSGVLGFWIFLHSIHTIGELWHGLHAVEGTRKTKHLCASLYLVEISPNVYEWTI